jgi:geranylgeranyl diphosphate synthase type I
MTLEELQRQLIPLVENELKANISGLDFGRGTELKTMLTYHMGWEDDLGHGKRLRPFLCLLCTGGMGADPKAAMPGALAIELLHNFTLIHDDIEDQSLLRHGRDTLWAKWGIPQAINAGDALFSIAQLAILDLAKTCGADLAARAALKLNQVCLHLTQGQHLDIAFETQEFVQLEAYIEMIRGKTAALIAFSTWLGGLVANKSDILLSNLYAFGENLGLAFQIQDDILGIWGDTQVTGKSAASDLRTHKKTLPVLFGLEHSPEFKSLWSDSAPHPEQVSKMAVTLEDCGARSYSEVKAKEYTQKAFAFFDLSFAEENIYTKSIYSLAENLLQRNS